MTAALNPADLILIPPWCSAEKQNDVTRESGQDSKVAITCDGWSRVARDHYLALNSTIQAASLYQPTEEANGKRQVMDKKISFKQHTA